MKKLNVMLMLLFVVIMTASSCMDEPVIVPDEEALPEITYEGKNVLACKINGKLFVSKPIISLVGSLKPEFNIMYDSYIYIKGADYQSQANNMIVMASKYEKGQMDFDLNYYEPPYFTGLIDESSLAGANYLKIDSEPHYLKLLHLDEHIAVGTFAFTAVSDQGDTVRITDGRFDIKRD